MWLGTGGAVIPGLYAVGTSTGGIEGGAPTGYERQDRIDSVEKLTAGIEAGTSLATVWKARPGYSSAGPAGIGISFASLRRF